MNLVEGLKQKMDTQRESDEKTYYELIRKRDKATAADTERMLKVCERLGKSISDVERDLQIITNYEALSANCSRIDEVIEARNRAMQIYYAKKHEVKEQIEAMQTELRKLDAQRDSLSWQVTECETGIYKLDRMVQDNPELLTRPDWLVQREAAQRGKEAAASQPAPDAAPTSWR